MMRLDDDEEGATAIVVMARRRAAAAATATDAERFMSTCLCGLAWQWSSPKLIVVRGHPTQSIQLIQLLMT